MTVLISIFSSSPHLDLPQGLFGWSGWLLLLGLNIVLLHIWRRFNKPWGKQQKMIFALLILSVPFTSLLFVIQLKTMGSEVMVLANIPWMLAAGLLGPTPAGVIALLGGILQAFWISHNLFSPLEVALLAVLFSAAMAQRYRTVPFRLLSHPSIAAIALAIFYPLLHLMASVFSATGTLLERLDFALINLWGDSLTIAIGLIVAGFVAEAAARIWPALWGGNGPLIASPAEKSLLSRLIYYMLPLSFLLIFALMMGNWIVAGNAARDMVKARMSSSADVASKYISHFMETGHNTISIIAADPRLQSADSSDVSLALAERIRIVPFFQQLIVLNTSGELIASYGMGDFTDTQTSADEESGIQSALSDVTPQSFTIAPGSGMQTAQISFIVPIIDETQHVTRVLIGRADFYTNPSAQPIWSGLHNLADIEGQGLLIDQDGNFLIHPDTSKLLTPYRGPASTDAAFFEYTAPDGTRHLLYYQPASQHPWAVVMAVPSHQTQLLALEIAAPLLVMIVLISLISVLALVLGVRVVTGSLQNLARVAGRISEGMLNYPLSTKGADEIGQLRRSFEQMRSSLRDRLDELNRLLAVSQGVASSLEFSTSVKPVLEAALSMGASSARVVLRPSVLPELEDAPSEPITYGMGPARNMYKELDEQILYFIGQQEQLERLVLPDLKRPRLFNLSSDSPNPASLLVVALRYESLYYGVLWIAYDEFHDFSEEEVRFMVTLGGQAALAAANARLFQQSEIERQRLEAILTSSPDPVLVTDQHNCLLLANPEAWQVLGLGTQTNEGQPIEEVISEKELINLMRSSSTEAQSKEIIMPDGRVYLATATSVLAKDQRVGRVCILRDVTAFKELDALKSEFVNTVSHDLRSPLTLMRGYATMLEMVGELNEQQNSYVEKIVSGAESMSRLVNNLLDLGRIEAGISLQLELVSANEIIEHVVAALRLQAVQKRIDLTTEIPEDLLPQIEADQALLQQALHNLVENGIKFTRPDGKVAVSVRADRHDVVFKVSDNGIGISPMDQQHLFEKFHRVTQTSSEDRRGSGLGLAITKSIADRHRGRVWAESQLGKGSTFYLEIPVRQPASDS